MNKCLATWTDTLIRTKEWKRHTRFGTWYVRSLYVSGSLTTIARELAKYKLHLVGVQEIRWDEGGTVRAGVYNFLWKRKRIINNWEQDFLYTIEYHQQFKE